MKIDLILLTDTDNDRPVLSSERAPSQGQDSNCQRVTNIWSWAPDGAWHQDRQSVTLTLAWFTNVLPTSERQIYQQQRWNRPRQRTPTSLALVCRNSAHDSRRALQRVYSASRPRHKTRSPAPSRCSNEDHQAAARKTAALLQRKNAESRQLDSRYDERSARYPAGAPDFK
jgi:hypothetical protein